MNYTVVPLAPRHIPALVTLEKACFSQPWSGEAFAYELTNDLARFLVAEEEATGRVLGYAGLHAIAGEGYITNIAVDASCRSMGVGKTLLHALCAVGEREGLSFLTLEVRASNKNAITLYERMGFHHFGLRPGFYDCPREDALIMTRFLSTEKGDVAH